MNLEIERKFLVKNTTFIGDAFKKSHIKQGFLNSNKLRVVRIRIIDEKGYITVKGNSNKSGISRLEWEKEIPIKEARSLMLLAENDPIEKTRYYINSDMHIFEIDVFQKENNGLILAEIELQAEDEFFKRPNWLGKEVTGDVRYYNASLSKVPFLKW